MSEHEPSQQTIKRSQQSVIVSVAALLLLCTLTQCDVGLEPERPRPPREYRWSVDTVSLPGELQQHIKSIWGTNGKNVYIVGHSAYGGGEMWHFDGTRWEPIKLSGAYGGPVTNTFSLSGIYGFSANNIIAVGDIGSTDFHGLVVRFDGASWRMDNLSHLGRVGVLVCVWGLSPTQVWAGGMVPANDKPEIICYDGSVWRKDSISHLVTGRLFIEALGGTAAAQVYAVGIQSRPGQGGDMKYFLRREQNGVWVPLDSLQAGFQRFGDRLWTSPSGNLYSASIHGVFLWNGQQWIQVGDRSVQSGWPSVLFGSSDQNIFYLSSFGLYHYNGTDWSLNQDALFTKWGTWFYRAGWTDGFEAFIGANKSNFPQKALVLHGK
jgi:hypothetical protein